MGWFHQRPLQNKILHGHASKHLALNFLLLYCATQLKFSLIVTFCHVQKQYKSDSKKLPLEAWNILEKCWWKNLMLLFPNLNALIASECVWSVSVRISKSDFELNVFDCNFDKSVMLQNGIRSKTLEILKKIPTEQTFCFLWYIDFIYLRTFCKNNISFVLKTIQLMSRVAFIDISL